MSLESEIPNRPSGPAAPSPRAVWLLAAGLGVIAFFSLYVWLIRLGDDLLWDEAYNFRVYARHPVIALALYWEPNNHVFETFLKSIPRGLLGLEEPAFYRLTSFAILGVILGVGGALFVRLWKTQAWTSAAMLVVLILMSEAGFDQAMRLRGYFLSMALALAYIALAARWGCWWEKSGALGDGASDRFTSRELWSFGGLSALLLWTLPSNAIMLPALWLCVAWRNQGVTLAGFARRVLLLGAVSGTLTLLAYSPVLLGFALDVNRLENLPASEPDTLFAVLLSEPMRLFRLSAPAFSATASGMGAGCAPGVVFLITVLAVFAARRHPALIPGLFLIYGTVLASTLAALIVRYPDRAKTPLAIPIILGAVLLTHAATSRLSRRGRLICGFAVVVVGLAALPSLAARTEIDRSATRTIGFLQTYAPPEDHRVLICNRSQPLQLGLESAFRDDWIAQGDLDLDLIFRGEEHGTELMKRRWLQRLRDFLLPPTRRESARPGEIDMLIYVIDEKVGRDPTQWEHEALTEIRDRLPHREEFRQDFYRLVVFRESPAV